MGFERFGRVSFTSQTKVADFVEYLEKEGIFATQCRNCEQSYFPPRADCAACMKSDMDWFEIEGPGKLVSFTRACFGPTGFEDDVPYVLAVAEFKNNMKVFGRFQPDFPEEQLAVGMELEIKTFSFPDGQISYEFVPA